MQDHPVLQKLASELDLCHTCGYVTLLKTGKGVNCEQHSLVTVDDATASTRPSPECSNNNSSSSCPRNGITNTASAEMLALELDSLDVDEKTSTVSADRTALALDVDEKTSTVSADRTALALDVDEKTSTVSADRTALALDVDEKTSTVSADRTALALDVGVDGSDATTQSCDACSHSDWVLLDCCYGIPLFDSIVNREVCDRISSQKLCNSDR